MAPPHNRNSFSEKEVSRSLENPAILRIKNELRDMADVLRQEDTPEGEDDAHMQRRSPQSRGRGPMANRQNGERAEATTERTDRILERLSQARGVDFSRFQSEQKDDFDDTDEESLPPPRPRPQRQESVDGQKEGLLTNRDAYSSRRFPAADDYLPQPELSRVQSLELELKSLRKDVEDQSQGKRIPTTDPKPSRLRFARKPQKVLEGHQKVDLLSDCLFYDFSPDDCLLRPIDAPTQILITNAKNANDGNGDESLLIDAVQNCAGPDFDLRLLSYEDFYYVLMWLQFNSYPNVPFDIKWMSKYGNENKFTLEEHNLRYLRPAVTPEQWASWKAMGLDFPRVRDREILNSDLDPEDRDVYRRAQYFQGNTPEEKVERFYQASAQTLAEYPQMLEAFRHGIFDHVDLVDQHYSPAKHVQLLRDSADRIGLDAERYKTDPALMLSLLAEADGLKAKADEIDQNLKNGVRVEPDAERVTLVFSPLAFFPSL